MNKIVGIISMILLLGAGMTLGFFPEQIKVVLSLIIISVYLILMGIKVH